MAQNREDYEKELLVPGFNKKEIQSIIQEAIDKGIVTVPSGGTKLYKHILSDGNYDLCFINTSSEIHDWTSDTTIEIYSYLQSHSISYPTINGSLMFFNLHTYLICILEINENGELGYADIDDLVIESIEETVTPL